jgi:hypothetical protein
MNPIRPIENSMSCNKSPAGTLMHIDQQGRGYPLERLARMTKRWISPAVILMLATGLLAIGIQTAQAADETTALELGDIKLVVPATWKREEPSNKLRLGQLKVQPLEGDTEPAELVISFFNGDGGGGPANVKRWIGQFAADGRAVKASQGTSKQGEYIITEISGTYNQPVGPPVAGKTKAVPGSKSLGVILTVPQKGNYFLKLTGPEKTVTAAAEKFRQSFGADGASEADYPLPE